MKLLAIEIPGGQTMEPPPGVPGSGMDGHGKGLEYLGTVAGNGLSLFLIAAAFLSLCVIILGGVQWSTSGGNKDKLAAARAKITWAIVGLVISLSVYFMLSLLGHFFGIDLINVNVSS